MNHRHLNLLVKEKKDLEDIEAALVLDHRVVTENATGTERIVGTIITEEALTIAVKSD